VGPWRSRGGHPGCDREAVINQSRRSDLERFRSFVAGARWRFAKTYVESYPHEYSLQRWVDPDAFSNAIRCIEQYGVVESFWRAERKYLYLDERKYWHMGIAVSENAGERPTLINRTWLDVSRYRENAKALGYDDDSLDRLAAEWVGLLERARRG
jgi:hypothetical protein